MNANDTFDSTDSVSGSVFHDALRLGAFNNGEGEFISATFGASTGWGLGDGGYGVLGLGLPNLDEERPISFLTWLGRTHNSKRSSTSSIVKLIADS